MELHEAQAIARELGVPFRSDCGLETLLKRINAYDKPAKPKNALKTYRNTTQYNVFTINGRVGAGETTELHDYNTVKGLELV